MMTESQRIADQLKRAYDGDAWHGPSWKEALEGVTAEQAAARPIPGAHSIAEIVAHLAAWETVIARRLAGETLTEPPEGDFPASSDWEGLLAKAEAVHDALVARIAELDEAALQRPVPGKPYEAWLMAHGAVGHALYHVGQIVLLKKMQESTT